MEGSSRTTSKLSYCTNKSSTTKIKITYTSRDYPDYVQTFRVFLSLRWRLANGLLEKSSALHKARRWHSEGACWKRISSFLLNSFIPNPSENELEVEKMIELASSLNVNLPESFLENGSRRRWNAEEAEAGDHINSEFLTLSFSLITNREIGKT